MKSTGEISIKVQRELERLKKKVFYSGKVHKELELAQYQLSNMPFELYDKITKNRLSFQLPRIRSEEETLDEILRKRCSISRFGDGEFSVMNLSRIHFQNPTEELARRLKEVITSEIPNLLIGLPDFFGNLDDYMPEVIRFWRKWMSRKRQMAYSYLDIDRVYGNVAFSRIYIAYNKTEEHYERCRVYFEKIRQIWAGRDVVLCEGEGTRFGMFNDLMDGAKSISRILCPARNAFDKYDEILTMFEDVDPDALVLIPLGPTATVLAYDLCRKGYQALDMGHLDVEYEWFLRKVERGTPLEFKYVDGFDEGRRVQELKDERYESQIIKRVL